MIKMVVCDMDGTIIGRDEKLPDDIFQMSERLEKQGILFTVATGRSESFMNPIAGSMKLLYPYVASNGATITGNGCVPFRKQFPISQIRSVLETARDMGMSLLYTGNGVDRITRMTPWLKKEADKHSQVYIPEPFTEDDWKNYKIEKVLIMDEIRDGRISKIEELCRNTSGSFRYVRYRDKAIEIMEKTADKGSGVKKLGEILGIDMEHTLIIGDDDNDIEMFRIGAHSAAVGNATEAVRSSAEYICRGERFEGVKEAVQKFCGDR